MKINRNNYEAYFLDYIEGRLNKKELKEIQAFLINNPDLEEELMGIDEFQLPASNVKFEEKEKLYINENTFTNSIFNDNCVAYMEDDLSSEQKQAFLKEIKADKKKEREFGLFLQTKLKPTEINFSGKKSLYRYSIFASQMTKYISIAALITLFLGLSVIFQQPSKMEMGAKIVLKTNLVQKGRVKTKGKSVADIQSKQQIPHNNTEQVKNENIINDELAVVDIPILEKQTITKIQVTPKHKKLDYSLIATNIKINDLSDLRALAIKKMAESPLMELPETKNKAWLVTKFIIHGIAKITKRDIEIKDRVSDEGKIEYLAISTPDFRYERNRTSKLFNKP